MCVKRDIVAIGLAAIVIVSVETETQEAGLFEGDDCGDHGGGDGSPGAGAVVNLPRGG